MVAPSTDYYFSRQRRNAYTAKYDLEHDPDDAGDFFIILFSFNSFISSMCFISISNTADRRIFVALVAHLFRRKPVRAL